MMLLVPGRMEWGHSPLHRVHEILCKCATENRKNVIGTGVPQPFLFVGLVGQLRKRGFGKWFVKWQ